MKRDHQRQRVYNAEQAWHREGGRGIIFWAEHDEDYEAIRADMQKYVNKILGWKWTQNQFRYPPSRVVIAEPTNNQVRGYARDGGWWRSPEITIPRGRKGRHAQNEGYLLHELSHLLAPDASRHDHHFCQTFLKLVKRCQGQESHDLLLAQFKANKVNW